MNSTARSKSRFQRAAYVLGPVTLDDGVEAARQVVLEHTGEQTAELVRRLLVDEARRVERRVRR